MAERKNRHLLEIARTLLFHMNVPSKFWAYAILIACYSINRFHSSAINYTTPHLIYSLVNLYFLLQHMCLVVHVLCMSMICLINYLLGLSSVFSLVTPEHKTGTNVLNLFLANLMLVLMLPSLSLPYTFQKKRSSLDPNLLSTSPPILSLVIPVIQPDKPLQVYVRKKSHP